MIQGFRTSLVFLVIVVLKLTVGDKESLSSANYELTNIYFERTTDESAANERLTPSKFTDKETNSNTQTTFTTSQKAAPLATNTRVSLHTAAATSTEAISNSKTDDHRNMSECFLPDMKSTRTCTEVIDKYLRKFIDHKEYRNACRVISTAMKCFHDIKNNIRQRCRREGAEEYEQKYIVPLVDQTKETVLTQCSFTSPYKDYFLNTSPPSTNSPPVTTGWLSAASILHHHLLLLSFSFFFVSFAI